MYGIGRVLAPKSAGFTSNLLLDALKERLPELALETRASMNEAPLVETDIQRAEIEARIAQFEIFAGIEDERERRLPPRHERLQEIRAWEVGSVKRFDIDEVARMVRMASLILGIRSRRHSGQRAIEASRGVKFDNLPSIELRAAEIVLRHRRVARNNPRDPASRIANYVRREWFPKVPAVRRKKGGISFFSGPRIVVPISSIVRIAVPILDRLAGMPIASGIPTRRDPRTMKPAGMAALYAIALLEYGNASFERVYKALLELRRDQLKQCN
jgi:hypothetical protein